MKLHADAALSWSGRRLLVEWVLVEGWTLRAAAEAAALSVRCGRNGLDVSQRTKPKSPANRRKPSDGLEPSTPSLPCTSRGNQSQPTATVFACFGRSGAQLICG